MTRIYNSHGGLGIKRKVFATFAFITFQKGA